MILEKEIRDKLKKELAGLQSTVARSLKINRSTVSRVLDGEIDNDDVIKECIKVRNRERAKADNMKKAILQ